jgi:hypothetical protein
MSSLKPMRRLSLVKPAPEPRGQSAAGLADADLRLQIVFLERPLPDDLDVELFGGLGGTGVDRLPKLVRRALGDHGDAQLFRRSCRRASARGAAAVALLAAERQRNQEAQTAE